MLKVQHWLQAHRTEEINVPDLADRFLRRFQKATGLRPTEYVQALRIALARERLEFSRDTVERIAWNVGYKDPSAFRRVFQKMTGLSASAYRDRFSAAAGAWWPLLAAGSTADHSPLVSRLARAIALLFMRRPSFGTDKISTVLSDQPLSGNQQAP